MLLDEAIKLQARADRINLTGLTGLNSLKEIFVPKIVESGYSELDAEAFLNVCIKYGWAQAIVDNVVGESDFIQVRPLLVQDFIPKDKTLQFYFNDKVVILFGLEDTEIKGEEYPVKRIYISMLNTKIIDIVDVQDLPHTKHICFNTPILYRRGDRCSIYSEDSIPSSLKFLGLVFYKA